MHGHQLIRCLHLFSRQNKDIALGSMANVLHRAKHSLDAAILMHAALETSSDLDIAYFSLGNIYAVSVAFLKICVSYIFCCACNVKFDLIRSILCIQCQLCHSKLSNPPPPPPPPSIETVVFSVPQWRKYSFKPKKKKIRFGCTSTRSWKRPAWCDEDPGFCPRTICLDALCLSTHQYICIWHKTGDKLRREGTGHPT